MVVDERPKLLEHRPSGWGDLDHEAPPVQSVRCAPRESRCSSESSRPVTVARVTMSRSSSSEGDRSAGLPLDQFPDFGLQIAWGSADFGKQGDRQFEVNHCLVDSAFRVKQVGEVVL